MTARARSGGGGRRVPTVLGAHPRWRGSAGFPPPRAPEATPCAPRGACRRLGRQQAPGAADARRARHRADRPARNGGEGGGHDRDRGDRTASRLGSVRTPTTVPTVATRSITAIATGSWRRCRAPAGIGTDSCLLGWSTSCASASTAAPRPAMSSAPPASRTAGVVPVQTKCSATPATPPRSTSRGGERAGATASHRRTPRLPHGVGRGPSPPTSPPWPDAGAAPSPAAVAARSPCGRPATSPQSGSARRASSAVRRPRRSGVSDERHADDQECDGGDHPCDAEEVDAKGPEGDADRSRSPGRGRAC